MIAKQLTDSLVKVEKHVDGGRTNAAMSALDKVIRQLENPKEPDTLTAEAAASLRLQASTLQDLIG